LRSPSTRTAKPLSTSKSIPGTIGTGVAPEARTVFYTTTSLALSPAKSCEKGFGVRSLTLLYIRCSNRGGPCARGQ
jgi:hypothetical protein